ncbi:MAG: long-chain acyl-CoA synthetase, partial [Pseudonocardiales bacterium]|nr:long-chain acyl-CoA synthetase [Pseudonocardiales bacterium]
CGAGSVNPTGRIKIGTVGPPAPGVQLKLDSDGEVLIKSDVVMPGYRNLPEKTAETFTEDGWLRTGDIGKLDDDGYLYLTGRLKNIIICGGFNVVPEEIEAALAADPTVREAVVIGVPDDRLGELPVALVLGEAAAPPAPHEVLERVWPRLAPYKRPRQVFVVDELPRVPNGKVDRPRAQALAVALAAPVGTAQVSEQVSEPADASR